MGHGHLPEAWQVEDTGCASAAATFRRGGFGGVYPNAFALVPGVIEVENQMYYNAACLAEDSTGTVWLSAGGAGGVSRDSTKEYALFALRVDLTGAATGGCRGDLTWPTGPWGICVRPDAHIPCTRPGAGAALELIDGGGQSDWISFAAAYDSLTWYGGACGSGTEGTFAPTISAINPPFASTDSSTIVTILGSGFEKGMDVFLASGLQKLQADQVMFVSSAKVLAAFNVPDSLAGSLAVSLVSTKGEVTRSAAIDFSRKIPAGASLNAELLHSIAWPAGRDYFNSVTLPKLPPPDPRLGNAAAKWRLSENHFTKPTAIHQLGETWVVDYGCDMSAGPCIRVTVGPNGTVEHIESDYSSW